MVIEKGSVRYQDSYGFYDVMYKLYMRMVMSSLNANTSNLESINLFYKNLIELFHNIENFCKHKDLDFYYRNLLWRIVKNFNGREAMEKFNFPLVVYSQLQKDYKYKDEFDINDYFELIRIKLNKAAVYNSPSGKAELTKHLREIYRMLQTVKRRVLKAMRDNELLIATVHFDAHEAIKSGFR